MESHPLNLAHQQHRRADAHLINNRYNEAMQCHHNAAELLLDAMKSTNSSVALESITLQHSYHLKQKDLIRSKKEQYARIKKAMDNIKLLGKEPLSNIHSNDYSKLQVQIYRAINETDLLLNNILSNKDNSGLLKDLSVKDVVDGKKTEKTQETVVEELQILSQNLHTLVEQLVLQIEVYKDENMTLKERVSYLEKERIKYLSLATSNEMMQRNDIVPISTEDVIKEPISRTAQSRPTNAAAVPERHNPPTHFDLSAFKDI